MPVPLDMPDETLSLLAERVLWHLRGASRLRRLVAELNERLDGGAPKLRYGELKAALDAVCRSWPPLPKLRDSTLRALVEPEGSITTLARETDMSRTSVRRLLGADDVQVSTLHAFLRAFGFDLEVTVVDTDVDPPQRYVLTQFNRDVSRRRERRLSKLSGP